MCVIKSSLINQYLVRAALKLPERLMQRLVIFTLQYSQIIEQFKPCMHDELLFPNPHDTVKCFVGEVNESDGRLLP